jgi:hypothetical protein
MDKLKVYLASRWEDRSEIIEYRNFLVKAAGIESTARWLTPTHPRLQDKVANDMKTGHTVQSRDVEDILRADVVIVFSPKKAHGNGTGGRHVECGIAIGRNKPILLCGIPENVFHCNDNVTVVPTVRKLIRHLKKIAKTRKLGRKYGTKLVHTSFYDGYDGYDHGIPPRK